MSVFQKGLSTLSAVASAENDLKNARTPVLINGTGHIHKVLLAHTLCADTHRRALFLTADEAEATRIYEDLIALGDDALLLPSREFSLHQAESASREYEQMRLGVLSRMARGDYGIVVAGIDAVLGYTIPPATLRERTLHITAGEPLPVDDLPTALVAAGYERCAQVEGAGQFAARGGIIDVFPAQNALPIRIELWGDTVDTVAGFDPLSQRRTDSMESAHIPPAAEIFYDSAEHLAKRIEALAFSLTGKRADAVRESLMQDVDRLRGGLRPLAPDKYLPLIYPEMATVLDYAKDALLFVSESPKVKDRARSSLWQLHEDIQSLLEENRLCKQLCRYMADFEWLAGEFQKRPTVIFDTFAHTAADFPLGALYTLSCRQLPVWSGGLDLLTEDLQDLLSRRMACLVLAGAEEKTAEALADDLRARGIPALYAPSPQAPVKG